MFTRAMRETKASHMVKIAYDNPYFRISDHGFTASVTWKELDSQYVITTLDHQELTTGDANTAKHIIAKDMGDEHNAAIRRTANKL